MHLAISKHLQNYPLILRIYLQGLFKQSSIIYNHSFPNQWQHDNNLNNNENRIPLDNEMNILSFFSIYLLNKIFYKRFFELYVNFRQRNRDRSKYGIEYLF